MSYTDPVGCCGQIISFEETGSGNLFIALRGLRRFRLIEEPDMTRDTVALVLILHLILMI